MRRDAKARTLEIHRLVQGVLKQGMGEATQRLWAERAVRAVSKVFPGGEYSTWTVFERLLPQAYASAELTGQWEFEFPETAGLLNAAGFCLDERARYTEAERFYLQALAIWERLPGPERHDMAATLHNLAALYYDQANTKGRAPL